MAKRQGTVEFLRELADTFDGIATPEYQDEGCDVGELFAGSEKDHARELRLAAKLLERSEPAAASVPLSAETAPAERERLLALDDRVLALTLKGQPLTATDQSQVRSVIRQLLAAPAVSREASVPQGGELDYLIRNLEHEVNGSHINGAAIRPLLRQTVVYLRALSSAPGEREGR